VADGTHDRRNDLKITFESVPELYQQARPEYPGALFDELISAAHLRPGASLLEVGAATGKATIPLAERGFAITCIEIGANLAAAARRSLAAYPLVRVMNVAFEDWRPAEDERYDLVFAATAWHWIDPAVGYRRAWEALRPGGHLAFWTASHVIPEDGDPFFREIQEVYDEIGEGLPQGWVALRPGELPDNRAEIEATGLFSVDVIRHFDWSLSYTAEQYIQLLDTFSGHIDMAQWQRDRLYGEIRRRLAARADGRLLRHWGAVLRVAKRIDGVY